MVHSQQMALAENICARGNLKDSRDQWFKVFAAFRERPLRLVIEQFKQLRAELNYMV
jgi:hypothetical protein